MTEAVTERGSDRNRRRMLAVLAVLAVAVGASGFAYAVWVNARSSARAQTTAEHAAQAGAAKSYGLQAFCTILGADLLDPAALARTGRGRALLARVIHYYGELRCDEVLRQPVVPLASTGATPPAPARHSLQPVRPVVTPAPQATTAAPAPSPTAPPSRPPPPPTHTPSRSPTPVVSACVRVGPVGACAGAASWGTLPG